MLLKSMLSAVYMSKCLLPFRVDGTVKIVGGRDQKPPGFRMRRQGFPALLTTSLSSRSKRFQIKIPSKVSGS